MHIPATGDYGVKEQDFHPHSSNSQLNQVAPSSTEDLLKNNHRKPFLSLLIYWRHSSYNKQCDQYCLM